MPRSTKAKAPPNQPIFSEDSDSESDNTAEDITLSDPPTAINPYTVLSVATTATESDIKSAYRKLALKHHPDKVSPADRETAHQKFQEIAFAYAILSDERRRKRYDATGNTAESANVEDDDFNWTDFFREMSAQVVSGDLIDQVKNEYQGSEEERDDVLQAYTDFQGDMDAVFETVMCSEVLADDARFRAMIDAAIAEGQVESYSKYVKENKSSRDRRKTRARAEAAEAMELAEELGIKDKLFGTSTKDGSNKKKKKREGAGDGDDALKALIMQRQQSRAQNFFDDLEAKYGGAAKGPKRKKVDEPPEEAFQKNAKKGKKSTKT